MKPQFKRRTLVVDRPFQYRMLGRMFFYLLLFVFILLHLGFVFELIPLVTSTHLPEGGIVAAYLKFLGAQKHFLGSLLLIGPVIVYDLLKFSNRFAGPLYRCRRVMRDMIQGKTVTEFRPRERDLMQEFFDEFNCLVHEWNARAASARAAAVPQVTQAGTAPAGLSKTNGQSVDLTPVAS